MPADAIEIADPDIDWPTKFANERGLLKVALAGESYLAIEHFGSTAVPKLAAKPIIDILVAVPSLAGARDAFPEKLRQLEYVFWADNPEPDRLFFVKGMPPYGERRTHHVHICERPSKMWDRLLFRDHLCTHPNVAAQYGTLKRELAAKYPYDREAYTSGKDEFIARIMVDAKSS